MKYVYLKNLRKTYIKNKRKYENNVSSNREYQ